MIYIKTCPHCKKEYSVDRLSYFNTRVYCSYKCAIPYRAKRTSKKVNAIKFQSKPCPKCGIEFTNKQPWVNQKFCSKTCALKGLVKDVKAKKKTYYRPNKNKKDNCPKCGQLKLVKSSICISCKREELFNSSINLKKCIVCDKKFIRSTGKYCTIACFKTGIKGSRNGFNNSNWKGGVNPDHVRLRKTDEYKMWRIAVFERDAYTCVDCGQLGGLLNAHHLKSFARFPELRHDVENGITVCGTCHQKYHKNMNWVLHKKTARCAPKDYCIFEGMKHFKPVK